MALLNSTRKPPIDLDLVLVVLPGNPEDDLPLRFAYTLDDLLVGILAVLYKDLPQGFQNLSYCLMKLNFTGIPLQNFLKNRLKFVIQFNSHGTLPCSIYEHNKIRIANDKQIMHNK
jgi:hypothetical protein